MIEENTSAVGAVANSATDLNGLAQGLRTAVGRFKTT
jgi:methyl-accepting chemotaxis protein